MGKKQKKRERTKDELIKSNKKRKVIIIALVIILVIIIGRGILSDFGSSSSDTYSGNYTGNGTMMRDRTSVDKITDGITGFIYGVVELEYPFALKFLMFLGAIYIFQVGISISGDIIQLFLIVGVAIYKMFRWTYYKIRGVEYDRR